MPRPNKRALIQDITFGNYYDIVGEVVKLYYSPDRMTVDLHVTDYTTNENLFFYEDPEEADAEDFGFTGARQWPGPYGQITIPVRLWEPHSSYACNNIREGDVVFLQDVHAKLSQVDKLEGALHQDQRFSDKVKIRKVTFPHQLQEHKVRKAAYEESYKQRKRNRDAIDRNAPKKPSAIQSAKRKETKKDMQKMQKELEQKELKQKIEEEARAGMNSYVRAFHVDVQLSTVEEIIHNPFLKTMNPEGVNITLPFVNAKYRTRLRVVDFAPDNLEDFARCMTDLEWNLAFEDLSPKHQQRCVDRWEWGFVLLVEDANVPAGTAPERLRLFVDNTAGQSLLKMSASDLGKSPKCRAIKQLEEKLFLLWGNLFELKRELSPIKFPLPSGDQRLQNKPFESCVEEYGCKVPRCEKWPQGWQRMHRPMLTVIMDD